MSRIYYVFSEELAADEGRPIGNGWRVLEHRESADGGREFWAMWKPSTGERILYSKPTYQHKVSKLVKRRLH